MYIVFGFLNKRSDITMDDFIDYYENKHVPLIRFGTRHLLFVICYLLFGTTGSSHLPD